MVQYLSKNLAIRYIIRYFKRKKNSHKYPFMCLLLETSEIKKFHLREILFPEGVDSFDFNEQ